MPYRSTSWHNYKFPKLPAIALLYSYLFNPYIYTYIRAYKILQPYSQSRNNYNHKAIWRPRY